MLLIRMFDISFYKPLLVVNIYNDIEIISICNKKETNKNNDLAN